MKKIFRLLTVPIFVFLLASCSNSRKENEAYTDIITIQKVKDIDSRILLDKVDSFIKKYPKSKHIEEIKALSNTLKEKEQKRKDEARKELKTYKNKIFTKHDEFSNTNWGYVKGITGRENIYIYGGFKGIGDGFPDFYRLVFNVKSPNGVFFNSVIVLIDHISLEYNFDYSDVKRNGEYGGIVETLDVPLTNYYDDLLIRVEKCKTVKVRFLGEEGYIDKTLSNNDIQKLRIMAKIIQLQRITKE